MPTITLPDGAQRQFDQPIDIAGLAQDISPGLARIAIAGKVDGKLVDLNYPLAQDAAVSIITERDPEGLEIIRHSTAHLLAHAVKALYPNAQVTIGPVIEDGFYYDFVYDTAFSTDDLAKIEKKMQEIAKQGHGVERIEMPRNDAIQFFQDLGETYKAEIIREIPEGETISLYKQGDFTDLCRGPHIPNLNRLKVFKLTKVAGAYWRGDSNNAMLQRIYGTAWAKKEELQAYLTRIEEAEKRDHRKIGKTLDLFHIQHDAPGMAFWHPNGWTIFKILENYMRDKQTQHGYQEIRTPAILPKSLWEKSGHWDKFREEMFITESEKNDFAIKPMSCPGHCQVFNQGLKSYRDLPIRFAEFGWCHRNEPSGSMHGLMRVRSFTQDDAHIFCTEDQIEAESSAFIDMVHEVYADFGFTDIIVELSTRPPKRVGSEELWDKAEEALKQILIQKKLNWKLAPGDGAFYGPKIGFSMKDCLGRVWTCGTLQLDFSLPQRLEASYVAEDSSRHTPVMLHRAIFGSLERFIGILIEHYAGIFPVWLAPTQVVVLNITDQQDDYVQKITQDLLKQGFRAKFDLRNEKIGYKIREHTLNRVPFLVVAGEREKASQTVAVRTVDGKDLGSMTSAQLVELLKTECARLGKPNS